MSGENIVGLVIYGAVALLMIGIGISQLLSREPVGFYSGEEHPKPEQLTDVNAWNKKHGTGWVVYGILILAGYFIGFAMGDTLWSVVPAMIGVIFGVIAMIAYHRHLVKKYFRKR